MQDPNSLISGATAAAVAAHLNSIPEGYVGGQLKVPEP
jgi:hypothetical protein